MKTTKIMVFFMLILSVFSIGVLAEENSTTQVTTSDDNITLADNITTEETTEAVSEETTEASDEETTEASDEETTEASDEETTDVAEEETTEVVSEETTDVAEETTEALIEVDEETVEEAGVGPDSSIRWGIERAMERIDLALTFNKSKKAQKGLEHARERLAEVQLMIAQNKLDKAEKAQVAHGKSLGKVKEAVESLNGDESSLEIEIEIEEELAKQEEKIKSVKSNIQIKIKGELTAEQQEKINALIASFENSTQEAKVKVQAKKDSTKIKIKAKQGKTEVEVEEMENKLKTKVVSKEKESDKEKAQNKKESESDNESEETESDNDSRKSKKRVDN